MQKNTIGDVPAQQSTAYLEKQGTPEAKAELARRAKVDAQMVQLNERQVRVLEVIAERTTPTKGL